MKIVTKGMHIKQEKQWTTAEGGKNSERETFKFELMIKICLTIGFILQ